MTGRRTIAAGIAAALLGATAPATAAAQDLRDGVARLSERIAEAFSIRNLGRDSVVDVYVRPPFDEISRVVCAPLSRRLGRAFRAELPRAFSAKNLAEARVVQRQGTGAGQYTLNVTWRPTGEERVELAFELGDLSRERISTLDGGAVEIDAESLRRGERECLARIDVINRVETAEAAIYVHRSADVFSAEIGVIEAGQRYRLLGRMPYTDGDWAVVKLLEGAPDDPFAETVGFATIPRGPDEAPPPPAEPAPEPVPQENADPAPAPGTAPAVPEPPATAPAILGQWQCQGSQPVDQMHYMQLAFQVQFNADGTYATGGQASVFTSFNNQLVNAMMVGEAGHYSLQGDTLSIRPQQMMPPGPLAPYSVALGNRTAGSLTMTNMANGATFQCRRVN